MEVLTPNKSNKYGPLVMGPFVMGPFVMGPLVVVPYVGVPIKYNSATQLHPCRHVLARRVLQNK
jgi:hypothetical protein